MFSGGCRGDDAGLGVALLESLAQPLLTGAGEERESNGGVNDGVEVDARPGGDGFVEPEHQEGADGEVEGELGSEPGGEIVPLLGGKGGLGLGVEEEGADVAADVC